MPSPALCAWLLTCVMLSEILDLSRPEFSLRILGAHGPRPLALTFLGVMLGLTAAVVKEADNMWVTSAPSVRLSGNVVPPCLSLPW